MTNSKVSITSEVTIGPKGKDLECNKDIYAECGTYCCYSIGEDPLSEPGKVELANCPPHSKPKMPYACSFGLMPAHSKPKFLIIKVEYYDGNAQNTSAQNASGSKKGEGKKDELLEWLEAGKLTYEIGTNKIILDSYCHLYDTGSIQVLGSDLSKIKVCSEIERKLRLSIVHGSDPDIQSH